MKKVIKQAAVYLVIIVLLTGIFVGLGTLSALIPHEAVAENIQSSSEIIGVGTIRDFLIDEEHSSVIDNYADAAILNIAWHSDSAHPMKSYLLSAYRCQTVNDDQTISLRESIEGAQANDEYSRYWHGMLIFVRPLLTMMDLNGIRIVNAVVLAGLAAVLIWLLACRKQYSLIVGYAVGVVLLYFIFVPLCMEYMPPFVLFHIFSILILLWDEKLEPYMSYLFLIFGALTCFFDFLTTETLVFVVPMCVLLCIRGRDGRLATGKQAFWTTVKYGCSWFGGYAVFYPIKWVLVSLVQHGSTFGASIEQAMTHGQISLEGVVWLDAIIAAIARIFPFTLSSNGWKILVSAILLLFVYGIVWFQFHKDNVPGYAWILLLVGMVPFARYLILKNHTIVHGFMVFRAQLGTFMALAAFMATTAQLHKPKKMKTAVYHKKGKRK